MSKKVNERREIKKINLIGHITKQQQNVNKKLHRGKNKL